jgi:Ca2+-binding EF-hand superfamily protein
MNHTGQILYTEFLASTLELMGPIPKEMILETFLQIDTAGKGYISLQELQNILPKSVRTNHDLRRITTDMNLCDDEDPNISKEQFYMVFANDK